MRNCGLLAKKLYGRNYDFPRPIYGIPLQGWGHLLKYFPWSLPCRCATSYDVITLFDYSQSAFCS